MRDEPSCARPPDELEDEERESVLVSRVEDAHEVRVLEPRGDLSLAAEAFRGLAVGRLQDLDRDLAIELELAPGVDRSHSSGAESSDEAHSAEDDPALCARHAREERVLRESVRGIDPHRAAWAFARRVERRAAALAGRAQSHRARLTCAPRAPG